MELCEAEAMCISKIKRIQESFDNKFQIKPLPIFHFVSTQARHLEWEIRETKLD